MTVVGWQKKKKYTSTMNSFTLANWKYSAPLCNEVMTKCEGVTSYNSKHRHSVSTLLELILHSHSPVCNYFGSSSLVGHNIFFLTSCVEKRAQCGGTYSACEELFLIVMSWCRSLVIFTYHPARPQLALQSSPHLIVTNAIWLKTFLL